MGMGLRATVLPVTGVSVELGSAPNTDPSHCFLSFEVIAGHGNRPRQRLHADQHSEPTPKSPTPSKESAFSQLSSWLSERSLCDVMWN